MIYAVIDTNVLVSALITKNPEAATAKVVKLLLDNGFVPMYDADIIAEYEDVLAQHGHTCVKHQIEYIFPYILIVHHRS